MKSFIAEVTAYLISQQTDLDNTIFVFPNKRAGRFFVHHLNEITEKTIFSPKIFSIEEFVEEVSQLTALDATHSIFRLYEIYQDLTPKSEREDFETFYGWSQTLIHDFNEIDRYLIPAKSFFNYLSDIQDLKHWSKQDNKTELVENYLRFWHRLPDYYEAFTKKLLAENVAYQGLQYRIATEKIESYLSKSSTQFIFLGFNALNLAEQKIMQQIFHEKRGRIFWDTDKVFFQDKQHGASHFMRKYKKEWKYYASGENSFDWIAENYKNPKNIEIIGVPKNVGQAKQVGNMLSKIPTSDLKKTALVLGEEALALPMLNSLPDNIQALNITMGLPLNQTPPASLFDLLLRTHSAMPSEFYYKNVMEIVNHPSMVSVLGTNVERILQHITDNNRIFLSKQEILTLSGAKNNEILSICFRDYKNDPLLLLQNLERLTAKLRQKDAALKNETLYHFHILFQKLMSLVAIKNPVKNIQTLYQIYLHSIQTEVLDFSGSPFSGFQIMGMLESRVLDFETVIITSVNEGILPAGKSQNSFIPYDLKIEYGLPTYKEKDAIYTYHFYRLLQRAKKVYILYNSVPGDLNAGEKSRFLTQLKIEKQPLHNLKEYTVAPNVPAIKTELKRIEKTPEIIEKIKSLAEYGFSPSALLTYIRNPLDFYTRYVLGTKETEQVEETVAANTLGTVIHDTLEQLYKTKSGKPYFLEEKQVETMLAQYEVEVKNQFTENFSIQALSTGKNLISLEVAKRYVYNFLNSEKESLKTNRIEIHSLEKQLETKIPLPELNFPVFLKGKADRIDRFNEMLRIIDYKTGKVEKREVEIIDWEEITEDYKHSKAFQVLCYAYMNDAENPVPECLAGIISFKNLKEGFLSFATKTHAYDKNKIQEITAETLTNFEEQLKKLILEICDPEIPFIEKEIEK